MPLTSDEERPAKQEHWTDKRPSRQGKRSVNFYLDPGTFEALKLKAVAENWRPIQGIMEELVALYLSLPVGASLPIGGQTSLGKSGDILGKSGGQTTLVECKSAAADAPGGRGKKGKRAPLPSALEIARNTRGTTS